jgi:pyruvate oxidase
VSTRWVHLEPGDLAVGELTTVVAEGRALCVTRTDAGWGVLDNRCPHQGGPLGDGTMERGLVLCPWHGYEYDPITGEPPPGFRDCATAYPSELRDDGLWAELPIVEQQPSLMDQVVDTLTDWGVDTVFGMVGHSNLGMADAVRRAQEDGRLLFVGVRHEGAAAFAVSAYGKLAGRPAAALSIAGPGATNLLTGMWDAKVDRSPAIALTGQVQTQVLGPGAFQEVPLAEAFSAVSAWSQTILRAQNATELAALAVKHATVRRDVAHLILPDEVQELPGLDEPPHRARAGRIAPTRIAPPQDELERAIAMLRGAERPIMVLGAGARPFRDAARTFAERIDAPILTTCGVVGRSGTPVAAATMAGADCMLVLGASFSNHSGLAQWVPTIQVDLDPMTLGKFHPVEVPLWGDIGRTLELLTEAVPPVERPELRAALARRRTRWRAEVARRAAVPGAGGRMHPARVFSALSQVVPDGAVIAVDVGNNAYAFGHYFTCRSGQDVLMSGYLGSIGFALPAGMGAWAATRGTRRIVSVSGDGGLGQYLAEVTTLVKYRMPIVHVVLVDGELGKISREQITAIRPVWSTDLVNPDFAAYARGCGAVGIRVEGPEDLDMALRDAFAVTDGPVLVEVPVTARAV